MQQQQAGQPADVTTKVLCVAAALLLVLPLLLLAPLGAPRIGLQAPTLSRRFGNSSRPGRSKAPLGKQPWTVGHRGASGELPEHTVAAYRRAIEDGADFIECDVTLTKDLHMICSHDPDLNATTDAWVKFRGMVSQRIVDGELREGIFAADLTLAQIRTLRARQRWQFRDHSYDGRWPVATLPDFLDAVDAAPRVVGIYPEVKHPTWHNALPAVRAAGTTIEVLLLSVLSARGYTASFNTTAWRARPALIQCFEPSSLRLMSQHSQLPLVLLLGGWPGWVTPDTGQTHEQITSDASLRNLAEFVNGMGVWVESLFEAKAVDQGQQQQQQQQQQSSESTISPAIHSTHLVQRLHELGFLVHAYTLRDEQHFVPAVFGPQRTVSDEMQWLFGKEGIDGAFADYPGTLHAWLQKHGVHEGQAGSTLQPGP